MSTEETKKKSVDENTIFVWSDDEIVAFLTLIHEANINAAFPSIL